MRMLCGCHALGGTPSLDGLFRPHMYALPDREQQAVHLKYYDTDTADRQQVDQAYLHDGWFELPDGRVKDAGLGI